VVKSLDRSKFTIKTLPRRIDKPGDLWQNVLGPRIDLAAWLRRLERITTKASG
jgi:hypothetical protein